MAMLVPNASEVQLLETLVGKDAGENWELCLYVNDVTPGDTDTISTYTEMSTLSYARKTLTSASWTVANDGGTGKAKATYAQQTFALATGTPVTVYGYFLRRATTVDLIAAERFPVSRTVGNTTDNIIITPQITLTKE